MELRIAVLPGDGIGQEVIPEGIRILEAIAQKFGHKLYLQYGDIGGGAIDKYGTPLPDATLNICRQSQAIFFGAVGGPKWDDPKAKVRPEQGLLSLRKGLGLFANLRLVRHFPGLKAPSPVREEIMEGVDLIIIRELTGGLYFGRPKKSWKTLRGRRAVDTLSYSEQEIERILRVGFEVAKRRRKKLASIDKANVLESSRLWRQIAIELSTDYPEVELQHILVDACAMRLIQNPKEFDVIVTEIMFGDILSDEAAVLSGSIGMVPSASLSGIPQEGKTAFGLYEPIHGTAPDIAGKGIANPIATILSLPLMLRYSFGLEKEAQAIEEAVKNVLQQGFRTRDIMEENKIEVPTRRMGELIAESLKEGAK